MSTHKAIDRICVVVTALAVLLTILFIHGDRFGLKPVVDEDSGSGNGSPNSLFTKNDLDGDWDMEGATIIRLNGSGADVSGDGVYSYEGNVVIASPGRYLVSGRLDGGFLSVDAERNSKVWILLDNVSISNDDDACLRIDQADKVFLTLSEGSVNTMECAGAFSRNALEDGTDGAIYAHDDLTINAAGDGSGSLTVSAAGSHGIAVHDDFVMTGGTLNVNASRDGIHANDSLHLTAAMLNVEADDDGIVAEKSDCDLSIAGGSFVIKAADDAIHAGSPVSISGGVFDISAGDDGIHSDAAVTITDCDMTIRTCYEGIEGSDVGIAGGSITIYPQDDGINASNGSNSGAGGMPRLSYEELPNVSVSGGSITIINENAMDADGIDSNGNIFISGGEIFISVSDGGSNSALDYGSENGGVCEISGGRVIACGGSGMAETFGSGSSQASLLYCLTSAAQAGQTLSLGRAGESPLLSAEIPCSFTAAVLSCPELAVGESYSLTIGDLSDQLSLSAISGRFGAEGGPGSFGDFGVPGKGFGGRGGPLPGGSDVPDSLDVPGGMKPPEAGEIPDGKTPPIGMQPPEGMEIPEGITPPDGMKAPDSTTPPNLPNLPEGLEFPEGMEALESSDFPEGSWPPGSQDKAVSGGERPEAVSRRGRQEGSQSTEEKAGDADLKQALSSYDGKTFLLLLISLLVLSAGLAFAMLFRKRKQ